MKVFTAKWWQRSDFMEMVLNSNLMEMPGDKVVMQPIDQSRSSSLINKKVMEFIEKKDPKPWAAYYSLTEAHTPLIVESGFKGKSSHGDYGDTILQMDAMVGKVLDMLDSSGQAENTLVYFTSDHGGHIDLGQKGGWNAPSSNCLCHCLSCVCTCASVNINTIKRVIGLIKSDLQSVLCYFLIAANIGTTEAVVLLLC